MVPGPVPRPGRGGLEVTLGPVGGFGAGGLPGALPPAVGRWAEVAGRYDTAYEAVREAARGVALPPAAVRARLGELADLAGGGRGRLLAGGAGGPGDLGGC